MKYRITVDVDGDTIATGDFTVDYDGYTIGAVTEGSQPVKHVKKFYIEKRTAETDQPPSIEPGTGGAKFNFTFRSPACRDELIEKLIYFESLGSFWWQVKSFNIREAHEEWIPENDADKKRLSFIGASQKASYPKRPQPMHDHQVKDLLELENDEKPIATPLAFYREGKINYESHKYINAFQNYFLMIEGLFGQGKSGNAQQIKALTSSDDLLSAAQRMIDQIASDPKDRHLKTFASEAVGYGYNPDAEGLIKWLVRTRGSISHFSVKSTKKQGLPHLQHEYQTHAYLAQGVCIFTYVDFHTEVLRKNGYAKR